MAGATGPGYNGFLQRSSTGLDGRRHQAGVAELRPSVIFFGESSPCETQCSKGPQAYCPGPSFPGGPILRIHAVSLKLSRLPQSSHHFE